MLVGREQERTAITDCLQAARGGNGGAMVLRGVAGSGKSTLLEDAVRSAEGMRVLRTSGVESESPLAFAALQRLLWPLRSGLESLPDLQRDALGAALGVAAGEGDRFLAYLGTLSILADAAESRPVVAIVDDAQWLDDASTAALLFAARRLQDEPVALLFAARDGDVRRFEAPDIPSFHLGGVTGADADALLAQKADGQVDAAVRDELVASTGGNPLAMGELIRLLSPDQVAGRSPLPSPLPLTGGVERGFLDRCRRLSEPAQRLLLVAATDDTAHLTTIREAADLLDVGSDALDEVERAGLVEVDGETVTMYHPLVRSAVYRAATSSQRRTTHGALAEVLRGDPDRRAWHLAAAADRPDDEVVAALDGVAERSAARGGHEAAAAAWARAAELTRDSAGRGERLFRAASSAWLGAHPTRAAALARAAAADVVDPVARARLLTLQGQIAWNTDSVSAGRDLILDAAEIAAEAEPGLARQLAMLCAALAAFGAHTSRQVDLLRLAPAAGPDAPAHARAASALLRAYVALAEGEWTQAAEEVTTAFALTEADPADDHMLQPNLGIAAILIGDDARGLRLHEEQLTAARRAGALTMVEHALTRGALFQIATGAWTQAASAAAEALPLAASSGLVGLTALPAAELAVVAALRGEPAADQHLAEVDAVRERHALGITETLVVDLANWARGLRAAQPATALHHLKQIAAPFMRRMAALDRLEAAIRADRQELAADWVAELAEFGDATGNDSVVAVVEHGRALLGKGAEVEEHFTRALAAHARSLRLPDRARTELAFGEHLRRSGRRVDAREHLRSALAMFEDVRAGPWVERAAQALRASGETARRRDEIAAPEMTAQERQVTALVRQGLSNKAVAAQLFVSPRTVDFHLRNVFAKLGVTSRAELTALTLD